MLGRKVISKIYQKILSFLLKSSLAALDPDFIEVKQDMEGLTDAEVEDILKRINKIKKPNLEKELKKRRRNASFG